MNEKQQALVINDNQNPECLIAYEDHVDYSGVILFLLVGGFHLLSFSSKSKYIFTVLVKMCFISICSQSAMESKSFLISLKLLNTRQHIWTKYIPFSIHVHFLWKSQASNV